MKPPELKSLLSSPLGKFLLESLDKLHDSLVKKAEDATDPQAAYGLLKEASGVIKAKGHLHSMSALSKDEGSKEVSN